MKFNSDEIASVIQAEIQQYGSTIDVREVGTVLEVGDGIARVYGLSNVMSGEMVEFPSGVTGLAFNLEEKSVGVIILGDYRSIKEGDEVRALGEQIRREMLPVLINPVQGIGDVEAYTVFCIEGPLRNIYEGEEIELSAEQWLHTHRRDVSALLTQEEDPELLSQQENCIRGYD